MATGTGVPPRLSRAGIFVLAALMVISLAVVWRVAGMAMRMKTEASPSSQVATLRPGEQAKVVIEIGTTDSHAFFGTLLEKQTETAYRRTSTLLRARYDENTKIVMGKASDVHSSAIVHVTGTVKEGGFIHADQIVVLTGYVEVH